MVCLCFCERPKGYSPPQPSRFPAPGFGLVVDRVLAFVVLAVAGEGSAFPLPCFVSGHPTRFYLHSSALTGNLMLGRSSAWVVRDPHIFHIVAAATDCVTVHRSWLASGGAP